MKHLKYFLLLLICSAYIHTAIFRHDGIQFISLIAPDADIRGAFDHDGSFIPSPESSCFVIHTNDRGESWKGHYKSPFSEETIIYHSQQKALEDAVRRKNITKEERAYNQPLMTCFNERYAAIINRN